MKRRRFLNNLKLQLFISETATRGAVLPRLSYFPCSDCLMSYCIDYFLAIYFIFRDPILHLHAIDTLYSVDINSDDRIFKLNYFGYFRVELINF